MHLWLSEHKSYIVNIIPYLFAKRDLDEELGCSWHVVVGQQFGMDITFEVRGQLCFVITAWPIMLIVEKFNFKVWKLFIPGGFYDLPSPRFYGNSYVEMWISTVVRSWLQGSLSIKKKVNEILTNKGIGF